MLASRTFLSQSFQVVWRHQPLLREGVADEDSRQLRDSLGALSNAIEEAVRIRRTSTDTQPSTAPQRPCFRACESQPAAD